MYQLQPALKMSCGENGATGVSQAVASWRSGGGSRRQKRYRHRRNHAASRRGGAALREEMKISGVACRRKRGGEGGISAKMARRRKLQKEWRMSAVYPEEKKLGVRKARKCMKNNENNTMYENNVETAAAIVSISWRKSKWQ